jgi:hypothetical protein
MLNGPSKTSFRLRLGLILMGAAVFGRACVFEEDGQSTPPAVPLDERLAPGQTRAGLITKESELIGGPTQKARVGDYKIYNDRIGITVGRAGLSRGYHPYGGTILDADLVREGPGRSTYGEVIAALDLSVLRADTIEVVNDGQNGEAARIRVRGEPDVMPLFDAIFSKLFEAKTYDMDWSIDYVLEPNADFVRVEHRVKNRGREEIDFGLPILAFLFGDGADPFVYGFGFEPPSGEGSSPYYGAVAEDVTYLYGRPDMKLSFVITESGIVVTGAGDGFRLRGREQATFVHHLVIGDGNLSKTQARWRKASGLEEGALITGRVVDESSRGIRGARVHAVETAPAQEGRDYASRAVTDAEGRYELVLPPARYDLVVATDGKAVGSRRTVDLATAVEGLDITVPSTGRVRYRVKDGAGKDLPVKLSIASLAGASESLPARYGEPRQSFGLVTTVFAHTGSGEVELVPGDYRISVSRGIEYEIEEPTVSVAAGQTAELSATLIRSVSTPGWMTTDTHIHAQLSPDSPDLYPLKVRAMVVENLEVPVSTEHEAIGDFNPAIAELGLGDWIKGIVGSEITTMSYGHFNAFPLEPNPSLPGNGRISWYGKAPGATFASIRANPGDAFIQVNHPRSPSVGGYFSAMGFDRDAFSFRREDYSADFDGIEVMNGCASSIADEVIQDWFSYLNHGVKKYGTASTDNHRSSGGDMGLPVTYVRMPTDDPKAATPDDFRASFQAGRLVLSCGPFVEMSIGGAIIGDTVPVGGTDVRLRAHVAAPSWMDVDVLDVIVNGAVVQSMPLARSPETTVLFDGDLPVTVPLGRDAWIALAVRGDRAHGVHVRGRPSFAVTNAIYVDGTGDGAWTMGR